MARKRNPDRKTNSTIAIFCEGESEKQYFNMLKQKYRRPNVKISVIAADLSGKRLIEKAYKTMKYEKLSTAYVVFDRDEHDKNELKECQKLAKSIKLTSCFHQLILKYGF